MNQKFLTAINKIARAKRDTKGSPLWKLKLHHDPKQNRADFNPEYMYDIVVDIAVSEGYRPKDQQRNDGHTAAISTLGAT